MSQLSKLALMLIDQKLPPEKKNDPVVQSYIEAIRNEDNEAGVEIANNLCKTYGDTPENVYPKANSFLTRFL